jgi:hypothetical protein
MQPEDVLEKSARFVGNLAAVLVPPRLPPLTEPIHQVQTEPMPLTFYQLTISGI